MVARGELEAPVVIGRDHLDSGSVASPNRETEAMRDGSDAVSDWPLLNALLNCASGATWVSIHHGGGVGIGYSQHAGMVIVCDGTPDAARRIERVLWNDPASGVMRHADAGYETAIECANAHGLKLPSLDVDDEEGHMLRSGKEHLESLRDGRVIYIGSERVDDVTQHPAFRNAAQTVAMIYEMKADPALREEMTYEEDGGRHSIYFLRARSREDLQRRMLGHQRIADLTYGMFGRSPGSRRFLRHRDGDEAR